MSRGLTNKYLENLSRKLLGSKFLGVYPCDVHPKTQKTCFSIIFNTAKEGTSGEHFVCLDVREKIIFYFDSFGEAPKNKFIKKFLFNIKEKKIIFWNRVQIQDDSSNFCGFYCLAFLMSMKNKIHFDRFINLFSIKNKKENDQTVVKFIVSKIK
jgi:hypothetical protein